MTTPERSVDEIVEWKDGMIVEFMAYEMHLNEGGSETWDNELSVIQRGVVLGDEVVGCDYELSKEDFVNGVWKDGIDEDGSYHVDDYVEAVLVEPDWLTQTLQAERQRCEEIVLKGERRRIIEQIREERDTYWKERVRKRTEALETLLFVFRDIQSYANGEGEIGTLALQGTELIVTSISTAEYYKPLPYP